MNFLNDLILTYGTKPTNASLTLIIMMNNIIPKKYSIIEHDVKITQSWFISKSKMN